MLCITFQKEKSLGITITLIIVPLGLISHIYENIFLPRMNRTYWYIKNHTLNIKIYIVLMIQKYVGDSKGAKNSYFVK